MKGIIYGNCNLEMSTACEVCWRQKIVLLAKIDVSNCGRCALELGATTILTSCSTYSDESSVTAPGAIVFRYCNMVDFSSIKFFVCMMQPYSPHNRAYIFPVDLRRL